MATIGIPLSDHNLWADFWYYKIGVNVIPSDTRRKKTYTKWSEWQLKPIPEEVHNQWKNENRFADGLAIVVGKVWRGEHIGENLIFIDLDNLKAIEEFCTRNGETAPLTKIAEKFIVEQHSDDTNKAHVFFYSELPFVKKSSDISVIGDPSKFKTDQIPAIEVKGRGTHGIGYCTPSVHKNGERYQIMGTTNPVKLSTDQANDLMNHIDAICKKCGLQYLENDDGNGNAQIPTQDLFKDDLVILEHHNRHLALLKVMDSLIKRNYGILSLEEIRDFAYKWNQKHCQPPLDDVELEKQWKQATKFIMSQIENDEQQQQPQRQEVQSVVPLTEELTKEVSLEDIAVILSTSIKKDTAPKLITFCGMLLAQTNEDQLNLGFQAESSAGKSYIPIEVASYFPREETDVIASASPTAFYHDGGKWDADRKVLIKDLEGKNLIFLDMPHFQLLEKLRPMLSHDMKELHYKITDKNQKHGLRTKNVIIRGYPSVFFCSTKTDPNEQEKTRLLLLSPSIDQEKLRESLELASLRKGNPEEYRKRISQDPRRVWLMNRIRGVRQWGIREIIIPEDGRTVYDRFRQEHPYLMPRHQRDFPRIFSFIKAHALLNCFNREKLTSNTTIATQADIDAGFALYKEIELSNELGLSPYIFRIYADVIAPLLDYDGVGNGVSREDIIKKHYEIRHKMLSPETLRKEIMPQLEIVGLITQEPDPDKKTRMLVYPTVSTPYISAKLAENRNTSSKDGGKEGSKDSGVTQENIIFSSTTDADDNHNRVIDSYSNNEEGEEKR
jgi:hypothetical protein